MSLLDMLTALRGDNYDPNTDPGFIPEDTNIQPLADWMATQVGKIQAPPMPAFDSERYGLKGSPEWHNWSDDMAMGLGTAAAPVKITRPGPFAYFSYYPRGSTPENVTGQASVRMPYDSNGAYFNNIYSHSSRGAAEILDAIKGYLKPDVLDNMALSPIATEAIPFWRQVAERVKDQFPNLYTNIRSGIIDAVNQAGISGQEIPSSTKMFSRNLWGD